MARRETSETRARILLAAEDLSCEVGPAHMSIEAVASRAGVSKGGLLYHFPTKQALLRALVIEHVEGLRQATLARGGDCAAPLAQARAYLSVIRAKLADAGARPGLFAAIAEDPEFIAPMRAFRACMLGVFRRCPNPDIATVVFLATEGLFFAKLTDPGADETSDPDATFETLERMLELPAET